MFPTIELDRWINMKYSEPDQQQYSVQKMQFSSGQVKGVFDTIKQIDGF